MKFLENFFKKIATFFKAIRENLFSPFSVMIILVNLLFLLIISVLLSSPEDRQYFKNERAYRFVRQQAFSLQASIKENSINKISDNLSDVTLRIFHCDSTGKRRDVPSDIIMPNSKNNSIKTLVGDKMLEYVAYLPNGKVFTWMIPIEEKSIANSSLPPDPTGKE